MPGHAAVGVDDDLAPRETGVGPRPPDLEQAGRVDQDLHVLGVQIGRDEWVDDVLDQVGLEQGLDVDVGLVLRGHDDRLQAGRAAVAVADGDLDLAVRPQIRDDPCLANLRQAVGEAVAQPDRHRHQIRVLAAGEAEHHPLVAGPLGIDLVARLAALILVRVRNTAIDVRRLLLDRDRDAAGLAVEPDLGARVADVGDGAANHRGDVHVGGGGYLPRDHDQARRDERLARDPSEGIVRQDRVQHRVGDLVGHLVGMTLGHRLRREQRQLVVGHGRHPNPTPRGPSGSQV